MLSRERLNKMVEHALAETCPEGRLPGRNQLRTNRFGAHLCWAWVRAEAPGPRTNIHVYCAEHAMPNGSHLTDLEPMLRDAGAKLHRYSFLSDVFIERHDGRRGRTSALLASEIEAYPDHGVKYIYEGDDYSDYLWDFSKLLYMRVPRRLFVACAAKAGLDELETTLERGYRDALPDNDDTTTAVVLLPAGEKEHGEVRVGISNGMTIEFGRG